jgi:hypothetical protein
MQGLVNIQKSAENSRNQNTSLGLYSEGAGSKKNSYIQYSRVYRFENTLPRYRV